MERRDFVRNLIGASALSIVSLNELNAAIYQSISSLNKKYMKDNSPDGLYWDAVSKHYIFQDNIRIDVDSFKSGSMIFLKEVPDAFRFGVAELEGDKVIGIEEKPEKSKSNYAVTGLYIYDFEVFDVIKTLKPSGRGELEITDVNNYYIDQGRMGYRVLDGYWSDAGTFSSLLRAGIMVQNEKKQKEGN